MLLAFSDCHWDKSPWRGLRGENASLTTSWLVFLEKSLFLKGDLFCKTSYRDVPSPSAKPQLCVEILVSSPGQPMVNKDGDKCESLGVRTFKGHGIGLVAVSWQYFQFIWLKGASQGQMLCWHRSVACSHPWVITRAFWSKVLWHKMQTVYFIRASASNRGKSSNLTSWIKYKQKCDKIQPEEPV